MAMSLCVRMIGLASAGSLEVMSMFEVSGYSPWRELGVM